MSALCGKSCISIRYFGEEKKKSKKRTTEQANSPTLTYNISGGSNVLMEKLKESVKSNCQGNKIKFEGAKYPILDTTDNPLTFSCYIIGLECDVIPKGIPGVTPALLWKEIEKMKKNSILDGGKQYNHLVDFYKKRDKSGKLNESIIRTLCQAFLYQPALEYGQKDNPDAYNYVFHRPVQLPLS